MAEQHQAQDQHEQTAEELHELKRIRRESWQSCRLRASDPFQQVRFERDHYTTDIHEHFDELEGKTVRLAGRMMSKRIMGKASLLGYARPLRSSAALHQARQRRRGRIQGLQEVRYRRYHRYRGRGFRTQKGEISVSVTELTLLSKTCNPLPEKWHGLKDTDMRYRQRYVDLIVNPEVRDTFEKRRHRARDPQLYGFPRFYGG